MGLDTLVHLVKKYGSAMQMETHRQIVQDIVPFITDTDLYITDLCVQVADQVLVSAPQMAQPIVDKCLPAVLQVCRSSLLQGSALDSILRFLGRIAAFHQHCPYERFRQELSDTSVVASLQAQAQRHVIGTLAKGLAAVVSSSSDAVKKDAVNQFLMIVEQCGSSSDGNASAQCELALLALGETGKYMDLSGVPTFCDTLLRQLENQQDEIRLAAALALGYATVGAMATLLKVVIDNVQQAGNAAKGQKTQYLLLTSLREVVSIGVAQRASGSLAEHLRPHVPRVLPILAQYADSQEESVRNVVSESLGHLLMIDQEAVLSSLLSLLARQGQDGWRVRASAVSAIRFAAAKHCPVNSL